MLVWDRTIHGILFGHGAVTTKHTTRCVAAVALAVFGGPPFLFVAVQCHDWCFTSIPRGTNVTVKSDGFVFNAGFVPTATTPRSSIGRRFVGCLVFKLKIAQG